MGCNRRTAAYAHAVAVRFDMSKLALPSSPHKAHGTTMDGEPSSDGAHYEASPPQPHRLWAPLRLCVWASWHCCPPPPSPNQKLSMVYSALRYRRQVVRPSPSPPYLVMVVSLPSLAASLFPAH